MQQYNVTKAFWILGKMLQTGEKPDIARFHRDKIQYKIHLTFSCASVRHIFVASRIILFMTPTLQCPWPFLPGQQTVKMLKL